MRPRERQRTFNNLGRIMAMFPLVLGIVMMIEGAIKMIVQLYKDNNLQAHYGLFEATGGFLLVVFFCVVFVRTKSRR